MRAEDAHPDQQVGGHVPGQQLDHGHLRQAENQKRQRGHHHADRGERPWAAGWPLLNHGSDVRMSCGHSLVSTSFSSSFELDTQ